MFLHYNNSGNIYSYNSYHTIYTSYIRWNYVFIIYLFTYCQIVFIREKYNFTPENNDFTVANIFFT